VRPSLVLAAVATVVAFATVAATHAYYADGELAAWPFLAGSLDLRVRMPGSATWTDDATTPALGSLWDSSTVAFKPGEIRTFDIDVRNDGSVDGVADLALTAMVESPGTTPEPESLPDDGELGAIMQAAVLYGSGGDYQFVAGGSVRSLAEARMLAPVPLAVGAEATWRIVLSLPPGAGDQIMDDSVNCDIEFGLQQADR